MKRLGMALLTLVMLTGCGKETVSVAPKKVNTMTIAQSSVEDYSEYSGYLLASEVKKYSFTQGGQILSVNVKKGQTVKAGDVLATLDQELVNLAKSNATANEGLAVNQSKQADINVSGLEKSLSAEKITLKQAEDALNAEKLKLETMKNTYDKNISQLEDKFNLVEDTYNKNKKLLDVGAISQSDFNNVEIQYNSTKDELEALYKDYDSNKNLQNIAINNAKNNIEAQKIKIKSIDDQIKAANVSKNSASLQVEQASLGVEQYENQLEDMTLKATMDGSVVEIVMKEGEVTGAGTPVVVVKSDNTVVKIEVPISEYDTIALGQKVVANFNDKDYEGAITNIASYPDETTKAYEVEVEVSNSDIPLGSLVNVRLPKETNAGTYIPINSVVNRGGINYVYTVNEENLVEKREVTLGTVSKDKVEVTGLKAGTKLILDNFSQLSENDKVVTE